MTKLKITGLRDTAKAMTIEPTKDGTYGHIGSQGGTEQMYKGLMDRLPAELKEPFNIICSRVRDVDSSKRNLLWLHDTWDDPESQHLKEKSSLDRFEKLIFVSNYQQETYNMALGVPYEKGIVLQNAIVPIEDHVKPQGTINLIYHTTPHRGLELLAPVADFLTDRGIDYHLDVYSSFAIYGWEHRDDPYLPLFEKLKANPNVTYHGFQPNAVIREALKKAHIYAYPSIWPETSGISVIEAMSAGCEIVCPNLAALPETTANFAMMYGWAEDPNIHANRFAGLLMLAIKNFWDENNQNKLNFQKMYANNFYSWDYRIQQWMGFLSGLKKG
jgi:glycosyltransferase involved in cell wall biosynthesis